MSVNAPPSPCFRSDIQRRSLRGLVEPTVLFLTMFAGYTALAAVLVFHYHSIVGDTLARVANGYFVVYSRDPKLAAVGFAWNPLPSLLLLPVLPLKAVWPSLVTLGFAMNLESSVAMATAVVLVRGTLADAGISLVPRLVATAVFALNPMTFYYAANGMSEALMLCSLLVVVRALARWLQTPSLRSLVIAGLGLGLTYMVRYEAVAAAAAVAVLVMVVTYWRRRGPARQRRAAAVADVLIVGLPFAFTFLGWALASWIIVGHPFEQFSSFYGNSRLVAISAQGISAATGATPVARLAYAGRQALALAPVFPAVALVAAVISLRRRNLRALAPAVVLGSVSLFEALILVAGSSFGWLRFQICIVPLTALLVGLSCGRVTTTGRHQPVTRWIRHQGGLTLILTLASLVIMTPITARTMVTPKFAREEPAYLPANWQRLAGNLHPHPISIRAYDIDLRVAAWIDARHLPDGSVLTDVANSFPVVLASRYPRQFIGTTDRDFYAAVTNPLAFHVRYFLLTAGKNTRDAIYAAYPNASSPTGKNVVARFISRTTGQEWLIVRVDRSVAPLGSTFSPPCTCVG